MHFQYTDITDSVLLKHTCNLLENP